MHSSQILPSPVRPPQQKRSAATLNRILSATEELLRERTLEDITLADILRESRVSVGAFYTRFANKDALIPCLYDRYDHRISQIADRVLTSERWVDKPLRLRVRVLLRYTARVFRKNRGLIRALALKVRMDPAIASLEHRSHRSDLYARAVSLILECREEIKSSDPEATAGFALLLAGSTLREKILYAHAPHADSVKMNDRILAEETAAAVTAYLVCGGGIA